MGIDRIIEMMSNRAWDHNETEFLRWLIESELDKHQSQVERLAELENDRTLMGDVIKHLTYHAEMWEVKARNGQQRLAELEKLVEEQKSEIDCMKQSYENLQERIISLEL